MDEAKPNTPDPAKPEGEKDGKPDEVLAALNEVLKRDFKSRDEALKSVDNLHRMVGDNAIAELREKAKDADNFLKVVSRYAQDEGVTNEAARKTLLEAVMDTQPEKKVETKEVAQTSATEQKLEMALVKLQERDLLEAYPEAKAVLSDLKSLRSVTPNKELKEIYEASSLKDMVTKSVAYEKEKATKDTTTVVPNARQANLEADNLKTLVAQARSSGMETDKVALVDAFFKAQQA